MDNFVYVILMILVESQVVLFLIFATSLLARIPLRRLVGGLRVLACVGFSASLLGNEPPLSNLLYVLLEKSSFQIRPAPCQNGHCCLIS